MKKLFITITAIVLLTGCGIKAANYNTAKACTKYGWLSNEQGKSLPETLDEIKAIYKKLGYEVD